MGAVVTEGEKPGPFGVLLRRDRGAGPRPARGPAAV